MKPIPVTIARISPEAGAIYFATSVDLMADALLYQRGDKAVLVSYEEYQAYRGLVAAAASGQSLVYDLAAVAEARK